MSLVSTLMSLSLVLSGTASQYAPGVMEANIRTRQAGRTAYHLPKNIPPVDGYLALAEGEYIGQIVFARPYGEGNWESFLVADCASKSDRQSKTDARSGYQWMKTSGIIAEVDAKTGSRWGRTCGGIPAEIIIPPKDAVVIPTKLGGMFPKETVNGYIRIHLAGFTILMSKP